jgi:hypothetical protein
MNALCDMVYLIIVLSVLSRFIPHLHNFLQCTAPYCSVVHICGNVIQFGSQLFVGRQRRPHQLYLSPEHWLDGAIPGSGVRLNRAGGMVVTPACHRPTIFPGQLCGTDCVLPDQQLWRLVWLAKLSADVGRTVRMLYRRHPLLWTYSRQYLAVRVGFVWNI